MKARAVLWVVLALVALLVVFGCADPLAKPSTNRVEFPADSTVCYYYHAVSCVYNPGVFRVVTK